MTETDYDNVDLKAVEMAAASPDPRVRGVAMRRMEIEKERVSLDNFLSFYMSESATAAPVPAVRSAGGNGVKMSTRKAQAKRNGRNVRAKTMRMLDAARDIIVGSGQPMQLGVLHDQMVTKCPDLALANTTSLRVRLSGHRDKLVKIEGAGYWPKDYTLPNGELPQDA